MENQTEKFRGIAEELKAMYKEDQLMRHRYLNDPDNQKWDDSIDHRNTERLKQIIEEIGWPSISKVGKAGSFHAWLLAQHADHDHKFQKKCLKLMKEEPENEIDKANIAFLEDRVAVSDGRPQIYGTQFYRNSDGQMEPRPILEPENIEQRRKSMGLKTFEEYQSGMLQEHGRNSA